MFFKLALRSDNDIAFFLTVDEPTHPKSGSAREANVTCEHMEPPSHHALSFGLPFLVSDPFQFHGILTSRAIVRCLLHVGMHY